MTTETSAAPARQGDLLSAFGRLWWVVLIIALLGAGAGVAWGQYSPQQYSSRVTLVVQMSPDSGDPETLVRTVEALLLSNVVLSEVVEDSDVDLSTAGVEDRLTVERATGSAVIEVVVRDVNAVNVDAIAQEVVPALVEAIAGLQDPEAEAPPMEVTSFDDDPDVISEPRELARSGALGGLAGFIVGLLLVALIAGRRT